MAMPETRTAGTTETVRQAFRVAIIKDLEEREQEGSHDKLGDAATKVSILQRGRWQFQRRSLVNRAGPVLAHDEGSTGHSKKRKTRVPRIFTKPVQAVEMAQANDGE
jgi:hypothetical protein